MKMTATTFQRLLEELQELLRRQRLGKGLRLGHADRLRIEALRRELRSGIVSFRKTANTRDRVTPGAAGLARSAVKTLRVTRHPDKLVATFPKLTLLTRHLADPRSVILSAPSAPGGRAGRGRPGRGGNRRAKPTPPKILPKMKFADDPFSLKFSDDGATGGPKLGYDPSEPHPAREEAKASGAKAAEAAEPRYANATLLDRTTGRRLDPAGPVRAGQVLRLRLDIGPWSGQSHIEKPFAFPDDKLPKEADLDVMVSSSDFEVGLTMEDLGSECAVHGRFHLPADGSAGKTSKGKKFLFFLLRAPKSGCRALARIGYYFRGSLVQSQLVVAHVGATKRGFRVQTDFTISHNLTNLHTVPKRPRVSVLTNSNGDETYQFVLRGVDQGDATEAYTVRVDAKSVGDLLRNLRQELKNRSPERADRSPKDLETDLRKLAPLGWRLYELTAFQRMRELSPLGKQPRDLVLQVARPTTSHFAFPWGLTYEIPLDPHLSARKIPLCRLVEDWPEGQPLITGSPRQCPHGPHQENVLCPFGFWGLRYAIEQLSSSDRPVTKIVPAAGRFDVVVGETQYNVDKDALDAHVERLKCIYRQHSPNAEVLAGKTKAEIHDLLARDIPLLYFYCHGERQHDKAPTYLGVGKGGSKETITPRDLTYWVTSWSRQGKNVWDAVRPLIFINACHSAEMYPDNLVTYLDVLLGTAKAAGLIGTEARINQELARDAAEAFFRSFVVDRLSVEESLRRLRLSYLARGSILGLLFTPYGWADLALAG